MDLLRFEPVTSRSKTTTEILTDVAEKASWTRQTVDKHLVYIVRENRKKISKINDDYLYLLFLPLIHCMSQPLWSLSTTPPPPLSLVSKDKGHRDRRPSTTFCPGCLLHGLTRAGKAGHKYIVPARWQAQRTS